MQQMETVKRRDNDVLEYENVSKYLLGLLMAAGAWLFKRQSARIDDLESAGAVDHADHAEIKGTLKHLEDGHREIRDKLDSVTERSTKARSGIYDSIESLRKETKADLREQMKDLKDWFTRALK